MSERAYRLAQYLEEQHGWNVFDSAPVKSCPSCFKDNMGEDYKYCLHCKTELVLVENVTLQHIEEALMYALKENH